MVEMKRTEQPECPDSPNQETPTIIVEDLEMAAATEEVGRHMLDVLLENRGEDPMDTPTPVCVPRFELRRAQRAQR